MLFEQPLSTRHKLYLQDHKAEHPFPMDGSDWSRLVGMRLDREFHQGECKCHKCFNFLTYIHSLNSPLRRETASIPRALSYWFLHNTNLARMTPVYHTDDTSMEAAVRGLPNMELTPQKVNLQKVEADWLKHRIKAWDPQQGKYWIPDTAEEFEAHPESKSADKLIDANRVTAEDERLESQLAMAAES